MNKGSVFYFGDIFLTLLEKACAFIQWFYLSLYICSHKEYASLKKMQPYFVFVVYNFVSLPHSPKVHWH